MVFKKTLLYPFDINSPYFEGYAWAVELALRMKAKLQLFTTTIRPYGEPIADDTIYHSLLEAHGYYLEHYQHAGIKSNEVVREPNIVNGDLKNELLIHLKKNPIDIVIIDSEFLSRNFKTIGDIERESRGMIILPDGQSPSENKAPQPMADHFYETLRKSELYKLPENFFSTLGNDLSVFNYLRKFFQKK
jgi:hypothetical protein